MMISKDFVTAGNATFTVSNGKGDWYTFRVRQAKVRVEGETPRTFVQLLTGPSNTSDFTYVGMLVPETGALVMTRASKLPVNSVPVRVFEFATRIIWGAQALPEGYEIHHEGQCGACGRKLTVPESIETGLGPDCAGRIAEGPKHQATKKAA